MKKYKPSKIATWERLSKKFKKNVHSEVRTLLTITWSYIYRAKYKMIVGFNIHPIVLLDT